MTTRQFMLDSYCERVQAAMCSVVRDFAREAEREMIPLVDGRGQLLNCCVLSGAAHRLGLVHRTADVIITCETGAVLLRQRNTGDAMFPGQYSLSAGGHCLAGEHPRQTARRELAEELGLWVSDLRRFMPVHSSSRGIPLVYREWESPDRLVKSWQFDLGGPIYCTRRIGRCISDTHMAWPKELASWRFALGCHTEGPMMLTLLNQELTFYYVLHVTTNELADVLAHVGQAEQFKAFSVREFQAAARDPLTATDSLWCLHHEQCVERLSALVANA